MRYFVYYYLEDKITLVTDGLGKYKLDGRLSSEGRLNEAQLIGQGLRGYYLARYFRIAQSERLTEEQLSSGSSPEFHLITDFITL